MNNLERDLEAIKLHKLIIKLSKIHRRKAHEAFQSIGLTEGQPKILDYLYVNDGCIQREIASSCNIEPATVTSLLANMEKVGLIQRTQNANDKRILNVFLTEEGRAKQREVKNVFENLDKICVSGFSTQDILDAERILIRLHDNLLKGDRK
ncbi:MarR family winged helix-turn-helix transcriptional regulator [Clostridium folliculivorans]|uniref:MarR family transcriptional regulator n=1 Tax=Clostridium folliculivorans TaxID=2886038 RepID=A0A9W6DAK4_9CLOT|nr:MarR family transcriptional regulator [Clostridium folliculivorans]GKU25319.1 MarR family transcriptional regulator [Clostridium folliculivorans]GKU28340.1 MarR family transcriptional regulator [Clostridium folliculivorans]